MSVSDVSNPLIRRAQAPLPAGDRPLDVQAVEWVLRTRVEKDSFETIEELDRPLAREVTWRRRRLAWRDLYDSGREKGVCINTLHVGPDAQARIAPSIAMAHPGLLDFDSIEYAYWQTVWASGFRREAVGQRGPRLFLNMRSLTCSRSGAPRGPWEDLDALQQRVRNGQWTPDMIDLLPTMAPVLREVGDGPLDVVRYLPAHPPSWCVHADPRVIAACNAGYFLNFPEEYEDGLSALHQPLGALFSEGQLHMPPWIDRPCALEWSDGHVGIQRLGPQNLVMNVNGLTPFRLELGIEEPQSPASVWRTFDPDPPGVTSENPSVELIFSGAGLAHVSLPGKSRPPIGGALVRLSGDLATPWLEWLQRPGERPFPAWELKLVTSRSWPLAWAVAGGPRLLSDGRTADPSLLLQPILAGDFRPKGPPPTRYPYDADHTRGPRTAIGIDRDGGWTLAVIDGRSSDEHSVGLTLDELARLMEALGCVEAMNLDGGGSSVMVVEGVTGLDQIAPGLSGGVVSLPSDSGGRERVVPVVLTVRQA